MYYERSKTFIYVHERSKNKVENITCSIFLKFNAKNEFLIKMIVPTIVKYSNSNIHRRTNFVD